MKVATDFIKAILSEDDDIKAVVENRIYPGGAIAGTTFPFLTFKHSSIPKEDNKDGHQRIVTFTVFAVNDKTSKPAEELIDLVLPAVHKWLKNPDNEDRFTDWYDDVEFVSEDQDYVFEVNTYTSMISFQMEYNKE